MKHFTIIMLLMLSSLAVKAQNIEVLKIADDVVEIKLSDGEDMSVPLNGYYRIVGNKISLQDYFVYVNDEKVGKYNHKRLKINNDKLRFYRDGNEVILRDRDKNIVTKGELIFDETHNYLKAIKIEDNTFNDKQIAESWLALRVIHNLNPSQDDDDFIYGLFMGIGIGSF